MRNARKKAEKPRGGRCVHCADLAKNFHVYVADGIRGSRIHMKANTMMHKHHATNYGESGNFIVKCDNDIAKRMVSSGSMLLPSPEATVLTFADRSWKGLELQRTLLDDAVSGALPVVFRSPQREKSVVNIDGSSSLHVPGVKKLGEDIPSHLSSPTKLPLALSPLGSSRVRRSSPVSPSLHLHDLENLETLPSVQCFPEPSKPSPKDHRHGAFVEKLAKTGSLQILDLVRREHAQEDCRQRMLSRLPKYRRKKMERVLKAERLAAQRRIKCVLHDQKMRLDAARQKGDKAARKELRQAKLAARAWIRAKVRWALTSKEALALTVAREVLDYITTKSFALLRQMMHQRHLRRRRNALAVLKSRALEAQRGLQRNAIETLCREGIATKQELLGKGGNYNLLFKPDESDPVNILLVTASCDDGLGRDYTLKMPMPRFVSSFLSAARPAALSDEDLQKSKAYLAGVAQNLAMLPDVKDRRLLRLHYEDDPSLLKGKRRLRRIPTKKKRRGRGRRKVKVTVRSAMEVPKDELAKLVVEDKDPTSRK